MRFSSLPMDIQLVIASLSTLKVDIRKTVGFVYRFAMPALLIGMGLQFDGAFTMIEAAVAGELPIEIMIGYLAIVLTIFVGFPLAITYAFEEEIVGSITGAIYAKVRHDQMSRLTKNL